MGDVGGADSSPFVVWLDLPNAGATESGILDIAGWAFSARRAVEHIEAQIGDADPIALRYGNERADVARQYPDAPQRCGFSGTLPLPEALIGPQMLTVRVRDSEGRTAEIARPVRVTAPGAAMHIDEPRPDQASSGGLIVSGWVFSFRTPVVGVEAFLGEQPLGPVAYGLPRPDLLARYGNTNAAHCGFWGLLSFPVTADRTETLRVRATDALGNRTEGTVPVRLMAVAEASGEIERARWLGNVVEVEGWCVLPGGEPPVVARVFLDGTFVGQARVDRSRPDIRGRYANHPAATRPGLRFRQPFASPLEPGTVGAGNHALAVEFADRVGRCLRREVHVRREVPVHGGDLAMAWEAIAQAVAVHRGRTGQDPAILDWGTGLGLAEVFPDLTFFSPADADADTLPYLDRSVDMVIVPAGDPRRAVEAERAAAVGVVRVRLPDPGAGGGATVVETVWLPDVGRSGTPFAMPTWSVVIPVFNHAEVTETCLAQLAATLPVDLSGEVIVVDDASTDTTRAVLAAWATRDGRIRVLRNAENAGFIVSCNRGAAAATGEVLVFLNNDTIPRPGWLYPLLRVLRDRPDAGAVGGKLLFPDGRLQEAGGVIYNDASGCNFGKFDPAPDAPLYNHLRTVDYCSGALLATWRTLFAEIGGFDTRYAPAYYEDTDYCFALRACGYATYYQPESEVVHIEGATSGTDPASGAKRYQVVNREKFAAKWAATLPGQPAPPADMGLATRYALASERRAV